MKTFKQHHPTKHINNNQFSNQLNKNINKKSNHHPVGVRVKLLSWQGVTGPCFRDRETKCEGPGKSQIKSN